MPATAPAPLSEYQRRLAGDPQMIRLAARIAGKFARHAPWLADDFRSAALLGLVDAARRFDPGRGVRFNTFATPRMIGAIRDAARKSAPSGFRRVMKTGAAPRVASLATTLWEQANGPVTIADTIEADTLPVGWEEESADALEAMLANLPEKYARAVRLYYLHAGLSMRRTGERMGLTESRVSQMLALSLAWLRERS